MKNQILRGSFFYIFIFLISTFEIKAQRYPTMGKVHVESDQLKNIISENATLEVLASGFEWTEGPVWIKEGDYLLFSDIPNNAIMKWEEDKGVSVFMKPSGYTGIDEYGKEPGSNGLLLDSQGRLVMCEHGDRRISVLYPQGGKQTLVDNFKGQRLNSPNDAVFHSSGALYFTDPPYGLPKGAEDHRRELETFGVYKLSKNGELSLIISDLERPNGIAFSPDEKVLYVAQSHAEKAVWMAYPVMIDGTVGKGKIFYDVTSKIGKLPGAPDGMKVDKDGNIFASGPGGIYIFSPEGELLGRIETGQKTSNCAWGGDGSVLYITADSYLCRIRTKTNGWK